MDNVFTSEQQQEATMTNSVVNSVTMTVTDKTDVRVRRVEPNLGLGDIAIWFGSNVIYTTVAVLESIHLDITATLYEHDQEESK